jgi:hypothetical protein
LVGVGSLDGQNDRYANQFIQINPFEKADSMPNGLGTIDWLGLIVPFTLNFIMLWVWYVWEGKREARLQREYEEANNG